MTERWPSICDAGLGWVERTEAAIVALDHAEQDAMLTITNAIEYQFKISACAETIGHLPAAMIAQAKPLGMPLPQLGLHHPPDAMRDRLRPSARQTR